MADDPQFVRLHNRLVHQAGWTGILTDLDTGWSLSGLDVQPFPANDDEAARFVRSHIRLGNLEPASQAEYDTVRQVDEQLAGVHPVEQPTSQLSHWPENYIAAAARQHHQAILAAREGGQAESAPQEAQEPPKEPAAASGGGKSK